MKERGPHLGEKTKIREGEISRRRIVSAPCRREVQEDKKYEVFIGYGGIEVISEPVRQKPSYSEE